MHAALPTELDVACGIVYSTVLGAAAWLLTLIALFS
jgi:hypothetical protein